MANIIKLENYEDSRGSLSVVEYLPFEIKRFYFIRPKQGESRGHHRHKITRQALFCISGQCKVFCDDSKRKEIFSIKADEILIIEPSDWHYMFDYSHDCIIGVFASEFYNKNDYIDEPYSL